MSARFQARSAFTGAGFTTNESEAIVNHPLRRRVVMTLMLLGNAGIVAAASGLILGFRGGAAGSELLRVGLLVIGLIALVRLSRSRWVDERLTAAIAWLLNRYTELPRLDAGQLLELPKGRVIAELAVREGDVIAGRRFADLRLRERGATVLGYTSVDGRYHPDIDGDTTVTPGDTLVLHAERRVLRELDEERTAADAREGSRGAG